MSHNDFTAIQQNITAKLTRRAMLGQILAWGGLAAVPLVAYGKTQKTIPPNPVLYSDGAGSLDRAAAIRRWYFEIDKLIQIGEKWQDFLEGAHVLPPDQVDGDAMWRLENETLDTIDKLHEQMSNVAFDDFYKAVTGFRSYYWILSDDIRTGEGTIQGRDYLQDEINAIGEDDPSTANRLQVLFDTRYGK